MKEKNDLVAIGNSVPGHFFLVSFYVSLAAPSFYVP
jgi:hypothetical protein